MNSILDTLYQQLPFFPLYIAIYYFFFLRPRKNEQERQSSFFENLQLGDPVITIGGIHGMVRDVQDHHIILALGSNPRSPQCKIQREAIAIETTLQVYPSQKKDKPKEKKKKS